MGDHDLPPSFFSSFRLWLGDCDMSLQLAADIVTLKLSFPHRATHLMKEFILIERLPSRLGWGWGWGFGWDLSLSPSEAGLLFP